MTRLDMIARDETITDALRAVNDAIGDEEPTDQAFRIIAAIKGLRSDAPVRVASLDRVDYLERVQKAAQVAWARKHDPIAAGPDREALAGIDTPLGRLKAVTWRRKWQTGRIAWATEYYLNDEPITIAEIRAAGLAQRPTTRTRQKKEPTK